MQDSQIEGNIARWARSANLRGQTGLYRERLVEELAVEGFLRFVDHDDSNTMLVILWAASSTHHLEHISDREVHIPPETAKQAFGLTDSVLASALSSSSMCIAEKHHTYSSSWTSTRRAVICIPLLAFRGFSKEPKSNQEPW